MDQTKPDTTATERLELLQTIARLASLAAKAEEELVKLRGEADTARSSLNYWVSDAQKNASRVKELEARIKELESPLAELARAANKE